MQVSRIIAPFAVATMVTGAVAYVGPAHSAPVTTMSVALTSAVGEPWTGEDLQDAFLAAAVGNDPVLVDAVQTAVTTVVTGLAQGKTLAEALTDGSKHVDGHIGAELARAIGRSVGQIGRLLSIAPTVVRGSLAISAALPIAFAPVATAVTVAFTNVVAALGTAEQDAVMQASRDTVASALHDALTSIAPVVQQVADDIGDALASVPIQDIGPPKASSAPRARSATSGQASTRKPAHSVAKAGSARAADKRVAHSARR